jgi:hypothetical protein
MDTGTYLCTYVVPIFIYVLFPLFPKMVSGDAAAYIRGTPGYMGTKTPSNYWFAIKAVLQGPQRHPSKHSAMSRLTLLWALLCLAATAASAASAGIFSTGISETGFLYGQVATRVLGVTTIISPP